MNNFISDLRTKAWRTAGARYNASRRLRMKEVFSNFSLAMLSFLSIAVSVFQNSPSCQSCFSKTQNFSEFSIILSVFLLVTSLIVWGASYSEKAGALYRNAEELTAYRIKLDAEVAKMESGVDKGVVDFDDLANRYDAIKRSCSYNHEPCDDRFFLRNHRFSQEFCKGSCRPEIGFWRAGWFLFCWYWSAVWFFLLIWSVVALVLYFVLKPVC